MSTNESAKSRIIRLEIESMAFNAIQLDHFKPVLHPQVINYRELDQFTAPAIKALLLPSTTTTTSTYHYSLCSNSIRRLLWWLRIFFAAGVTARRGHSLQPSQFNHPYQSNVKAAQPAIHWPQTILSLPPPVLPDSLIRYTQPSHTVH